MLASPVIIRDSFMSQACQKALQLSDTVLKSTDIQLLLVRPWSELGLVMTPYSQVCACRARLLGSITLKPDQSVRCYRDNENPLPYLLLPCSTSLTSKRNSGTLHLWPVHLLLRPRLNSWSVHLGFGYL
jgi:hypothetical protein